MGHAQTQGSRGHTLGDHITMGHQHKADERHNALAGSEAHQEQWKRRQDLMIGTGVKPFAEAIYKHAANQYHETYLSWKSIIWLQNILEKKKIPFMFTLADNSLFYEEFEQHKDQDPFMKALHGEIDFTKWFTFGERMMGFNQWSLLEDYPRGTTHPLDEAHEDAVKLMLPQFKKSNRREIMFTWIKKIINKVKQELAYRKRLKELKKKDPFIYK